MRIRTVKPEFFKHEDLFDLEQETRLPIRTAFIGLWCASDKEGRFRWRPRPLKTDILPYDDCDFSRVLDALATRGFVVKYTCGTEDFGWIPSFRRHQHINPREKESEIPPQPENAEEQALTTRHPRVIHACPTGQENFRGEGEGEGEGEYGKDKDIDTDVSIVHLDSDESEKHDPAPQIERNGDQAELPLHIPTDLNQKIVDLYHEKCPSLPKVKKLTPTRKQAIRNRWREYKADIRVFRILFETAEYSDFLSGRNGRWNGCNLDWLLQSRNMIRVLEGNYNNPENRKAL